MNNPELPPVSTKAMAKAASKAMLESLLLTNLDAYAERLVAFGETYAAILRDAYAAQLAENPNRQPTRPNLANNTELQCAFHKLATDPFFEGAEEIHILNMRSREAPGNDYVGPPIQWDPAFQKMFDDCAKRHGIKDVKTTHDLFGKQTPKTIEAISALRQAILSVSQYRIEHKHRTATEVAEKKPYMFANLLDGKHIELLYEAESLKIDQEFQEKWQLNQMVISDVAFLEGCLVK